MFSFSLADHQYMARAIKLADKGRFTTSPNPRVGCVLVKNEQIIGEGFHQKAGSGHAEVNALAHAKAQGHDPQGSTAYVTLEPCSHVGRTPPCAKALIDAKVARVVAAMVDPNPRVSGRGLALLSEAGIVAEHGLLSAESATLNLGFITLMTDKRPYVRCKLATSLDGKTAMASGESKWITSAAARQDVQRLRAQSCAVITGADSVMMDQAKMTVRHDELGELGHHYHISMLRQPVRVVIDSQNRLTPELALFAIESPVLIFGTHIENIHQWPHFVEHVCVSPSPKQAVAGKVDLVEVLAELARRGLNDVLIEAGAHLAGAFIEQNLVDELIHYQAPKLLGADGKSMAVMPDISSLSQAKNLQIKHISMVGPDIKITALLSKS